jgi:hypothetical protein
VEAEELSLAAGAGLFERDAFNTGGFGAGAFGIRVFDT